MNDTEEDKSDLSFDTIELELSEEKTNFNRRLTGFETIKEFFKKEVEYWSNIPNADGTVSKIRSAFESRIDSLNSFKNTNDPADSSEFKHNWNTTANQISNPKIQQYNHSFRVMYSDTAHAEFVRENYETDTEYGEGALLYFVREQKDWVPNQKKKLIGFIHSYEFDHKDSEIGLRSDAEKTKLSELKNKWGQRVEDLEKDYQDFKSEFSQWREKKRREYSEWMEAKEDEVNSLLTERSEKLDQLEKAYNEKLELKAPVDYWNDKSSSHFWQGIIFLALTALSVTGLIGLLLDILYDLPQGFHKKIFEGDPGAIKSFIVLASILSFGAFIVGFLSKLTLSSFHLQRDAQERKNLTLVYLALVEDGSVTDEERSIILESLFSRADTGLIKGDDSPTMPSGMDQIIQKLKK